VSTRVVMPLEVAVEEVSSAVSFDHTGLCAC